MSIGTSLRRALTVYNKNVMLWQNKDEFFFRHYDIRPILQTGPRFVATTLAMLTQKTPEDFQGKINTQDPTTWSQVLQSYGMKMAYCPSDVRKLKYYMNQLIDMDDLFMLNFYTSAKPEDILGDPNRDGWVTGSHIVILHRDKILDPATGTATPALEHNCNNYHTKRIFRIVPTNHTRGL